jgi:hypothetical protein
MPRCLAVQIWEVVRALSFFLLLSQNHGYPMARVLDCFSDFSETQDLAHCRERLKKGLLRLFSQTKEGICMHYFWEKIKYSSK